MLFLAPRHLKSRVFDGCGVFHSLDGLKSNIRLYGKGTRVKKLVLDYLDSKIRGFGIISWIRWALLLGFRELIGVIRGFKVQLGLGFRE